MGDLKRRTKMSNEFGNKVENFVTTVEDGPKRGVHNTKGGSDRGMS